MPACLTSAAAGAAGAAPAPAAIASALSGLRICSPSSYMHAHLSLHSFVLVLAFARLHPLVALFMLVPTCLCPFVLPPSSLLSCWGCTYACLPPHHPPFICPHNFLHSSMPALALVCSCSHSSLLPGCAHFTFICTSPCLFGLVQALVDLSLYQIDSG